MLLRRIHSLQPARRIPWQQHDSPASAAMDWRDAPTPDCQDARPHVWEARKAAIPDGFVHSPLAFAARGDYLMRVEQAVMKPPAAKIRPSRHQVSRRHHTRERMRCEASRTTT